MARGRKQIAFDLDTNAMRQVYPTDSWRNGYDDIKKFMQMAGFEWRQGSVYISARPMAKKEVDALMGTLSRLYPWLNGCMRDCTVTNIGKEFSLNHIFDKENGVTKEKGEHTRDDSLRRLLGIEIKDAEFREDWEPIQENPEPVSEPEHIQIDTEIFDMEL